MIRTIITGIFLALSPASALAQVSPQSPNLFWSTPLSGSGNLGLRPIGAADLSAILAGSLSISGVPFNPSVSPPGSFSPPANPGILMTGGKPLYIAGAPTSASQDTPAGTLYVTKNTNYVGVPSSGSPPAIYGANFVAAGAQGPQEGLTGYVANANTAGSEPSGPSGAIGVQGVGACSVAGCTAIWGGTFSAYGFGAANPTNPSIGLEVDNYDVGTDTADERVGIELACGIGPFSGTAPTCGNLFLVGGNAGNVFNYSGAAVNGLNLNGGTFSGAAIITPGFYVDGSGNAYPNTVKLASLTFSTLPTCNMGNTGVVAFITDASTTPAYNTAVTAGGGSFNTLVLCRNSVWTFH